MTQDPIQPDDPSVSIVIPSVGRPDHLAACLDAIDRTVRAPHEVICVTIATDTDTQRELERRPGVQNLIDPERTGFVRAANRGFRAARGRWVVHLNDDCELMPHAVDNALFFSSVPGMDGVGQIAFFHDTPVRRNIWREVTVEGTRYVMCHVRGVPFANFGMTRRAVLERVGYFDERFAMYGADPDLSLKIWFEAGLRVEACPGALVRHAELDDDRGARERAAQHEDNVKLFEKWGLAPGGQAGR